MPVRVIWFRRNPLLGAGGGLLYSQNGILVSRRIHHHTSRKTLHRRGGKGQYPTESDKYFK